MKLFLSAVFSIVSIVILSLFISQQSFAASCPTGGCTSDKYECFNNQIRANTNAKQVMDDGKCDVQGNVCEVKGGTVSCVSKDTYCGDLSSNKCDSSICFLYRGYKGDPGFSIDNPQCRANTNKGGACGDDNVSCYSDQLCYTDQFPDPVNTYCAKPGFKQEGGRCVTTNQCAGGLFCGTDFKCTKCYAGACDSSNVPPPAPGGGTNSSAQSCKDLPSTDPTIILQSGCYTKADAPTTNGWNDTGRQYSDCTGNQSCYIYTPSSQPATTKTKCEDVNSSLYSCNQTPKCTNGWQATTTYTCSNGNQCCAYVGIPAVPPPVDGGKTPPGSGGGTATVDKHDTPPDVGWCTDAQRMNGVATSTNLPAGCAPDASGVIQNATYAGNGGTDTDSFCNTKTSGNQPYFYKCTGTVALVHPAPATLTKSGVLSCSANNPSIAFDYTPSKDADFHQVLAWLDTKSGNPALSKLLDGTNKFVAGPELNGHKILYDVYACPKGATDFLKDCTPSSNGYFSVEAADIKALNCDKGATTTPGPSGPTFCPASQADGGFKQIGCKCTIGFGNCNTSDDCQLSKDNQNQAYCSPFSPIHLLWCEAANRVQATATDTCTASSATNGAGTVDLLGACTGDAQCKPIATGDVKCKLDKVGMTCQRDSGPLSCPGGHQCGGVGTCFGASEACPATSGTTTTALSVDCPSTDSDHKANKCEPVGTESTGYKHSPVRSQADQDCTKDGPAQWCNHQQ